MSGDSKNQPSHVTFSVKKGAAECTPWSGLRHCICMWTISPGREQVALSRSPKCFQVSFSEELVSYPASSTASQCLFPVACSSARQRGWIAGVCPKAVPSPAFPNISLLFRTSGVPLPTLRAYLTLSNSVNPCIFFPAVPPDLGVF